MKSAAVPGSTARPVYLGAAVAIALVMFVGFARNYYLREWFGTRAITFMVHVHGLVMTGWVALFLTQVLFVAKHRIDLHRRLGVFGAVLAALVLVLGVCTITQSIQRQIPQAGPVVFALAFVAFDGVILCVFAGLVLLALLKRRRSEWHKRLMLLAMISLLPPAFGRFVAYFTLEHVEIIVFGLMSLSVLACLGMDLRRHRVVHPAFVLGGALVILSNLVTYVAQVTGE
jgi:uncharacterized membrane protein YozB (DUF420 family)